MRDIDEQFGAYEHLRHLPRQDEALLTLRKAASVVKPIMRKRGWRVGTLAEFVPDDARLLGLNINHGEKILIRLRYTPDPKQFCPFDAVIDTLLHELVHIVQGPHDDRFHKIWNELRDEHQTLKMQGFTGEGFLGRGKKVGGRHIPIDEVRRQARVAAEKRRAAQGPGTARRLGGAPVQRGVDMRSVIADAVEKRNAVVTQGCASGTKQAEALAKEAAKHGFKTVAEMDEANERAIAEALVELEVEAEQREKDATMYPESSGGLTWTKEGGLEIKPPSPSQSAPPKLASTSVPPPAPPQVPRGSNGLPIKSREPPKAQPPATRQGKPVSRLVLEAEARKKKSHSSPGTSSSTPKGSTASDPVDLTSLVPPPTDRLAQQSGLSSYTADAAASSSRDIWTCAICTLENPVRFLCCDACGVERPEAELPTVTTPLSFPPGLETAPLSGTRPPAPAQTDGWGSDGRPLGWACNYCGTFMEREWWTCSACGLMKTAAQA